MSNWERGCWYGYIWAIINIFALQIVVGSVETETLVTSLALLFAFVLWRTR